MPGDIPWVKFYPGKFKYMKRVGSGNRRRIVAFDLDETLGYFADLHILWNSLPRETFTPPEKHTVFGKLLDLYPEFIRAGIIKILRFISRKIRDGKCGKILLYTNNQCRYPEWIGLLLYYFDRKLCAETETMFDRPICAFKIKKQVIEPGRTTRDKIHGEMLKCAKLPYHTEICYIDDTHYLDMEHANVYYIQPPPYYHDLTAREIERRLIYSQVFNDLGVEEYEFPEDIDNSSVPIRSIGVEHADVAKEIEAHIRAFFLMSSMESEFATRKYMRHLGRKTRRRLSNNEKMD
jgi:hypothetical protein